MLFHGIIITLLGVGSTFASYTPPSGCDALEQDLTSIQGLLTNIATALGGSASPNETVIAIELGTLQTTVQNATTDATGSGILSVSESTTVTNTLSSISDVTQAILTNVIARNQTITDPTFRQGVIAALKALSPGLTNLYSTIEKHILDLNDIKTIAFASGVIEGTIAVGISGLQT